MKDVELRIDFRAALAKLAPSQLQGSWQLPTELARLAIASGARSVELEIRRSRLTLRAPGARLGLHCLSDLRTLLDAAAADCERHRSLVALEERDGLALAALAGLASEILEIRSGGAEAWSLSQSAGGRPALRRLSGAPSDLELKLQGIRLDATAAEHWLARNGRFASVPIVIGAQPIARGFSRPLIRIRVREPLPAALAIAERGEAPRLWLLRYGIISTRATVPGYPAFEAAVEMSSVSAPGATPAMLREAVQPHLESLVQAAVGLIGQLAHHAESLNSSARERAARLLLEASRRGRYREQLKTIRVFPQIVGNGDSRRRLVSIADLEYLVRFDGARGESGRAGAAVRIDAIAADQDPGELALAGRQVLVLSSFERTLLAELLDVRFVTPPARPRSYRSVRHLVEMASGRLSLAWYRLRGRLVPESELSPGEKAFLATLTRSSAGGLPRTVTFCAGGGRIHLTGDGRLLLPRRNRVVEASVEAVARDADWLYPVLTGLLGGRDLPSAEIRERWSKALAGPAQRFLAP